MSENSNPTELKKILTGWKIIRPELDLNPEYYALLQKAMAKRNIQPEPNSFSGIKKDRINIYFMELLKEDINQNGRN
jgi:hypothetical protein